MSKVDNTSRKEQNRNRLKEIGFQPGDQRINRGGRPKGSRNKFAEEFIKDFLRDWELNGKAAIRKARKTDPVAYLKVAASLLPKEFDLNVSNSAELEKMLAKFDDEQLEAIFAAITAAGSNVAKGTTQEKVRAKPNSLH